MTRRLAVHEEEWYPVYEFSEPTEHTHVWATIVDVDDALYRRYQRTLAAFKRCQAALGALLDEAEQTRPDPPGPPLSVATAAFAYRPAAGWLGEPLCPTPDDAA